jgi:tetrahydromethanopterin S-methyltransferase subunit G
MTTKKLPQVKLKGVKEDLLKVIDKLEDLEQKITNVAFRVKRLEQRVGIV